MAIFTQEKRLLQIKSSLGTDVLLMAGFNGTEEISRPFSFQLDLLSENEAIAAKDIVGTSVTWSVNYVHTAPRLFNGFVNRFSAGSTRIRDMRLYRAEVVPWLWFLTRTTNCRIFQNKTSIDIIKQVFSDLGFSDFQVKTTGSYGTRDYCVQYRETAFNFVSRLMEEDGIYYFFTHEDGKHTMVLADDKSVFQDVPETPVSYAEGSLSPNHVSAWDHQYAYRSGKWAQTDYNFETPSTSLLTSTDTVVQLPGISGYELFDYPGLYLKTSDGSKIAKVRIQADESPYDVAVGSSHCCTFTAGGKFTLEKHSCDSENQAYAFTAVQHMATETSYDSGGGAASYSNTFSCIPATVAFRPPRVTPKPAVQGIQTAVVVGKSGEEIYVDKYGRVKVQFYWDRLGQKDENSSCWIRVAENWAGKNWGIIFNPRIGQEVIVDFLEGDPDRPLITGRVYNAEQMPPYTLPDNQTQSTIKSRSSKGGSTDNFNELRFEDKKDSEEVYFHAEKDFNRVVENNDTLKVGFLKKDKGDQTEEIFNNQSLKVGCKDADDGSQTTEVWNSQSLKVGSGAGQAKEGSQTISVYKDRTTSIETGNETLTVKKGDRAVTVSTGNDTHDVKTGNRTVTVDKGNDTHQVKMGNREVKIDMGNDSLKISMGNQTTKLDLGASSTEAMQSITLKVGQSSVTIDNMGVTIKGMMISIQGQVQSELKGLMTTVSGDAMLQAKGAITMIG